MSQQNTIPKRLFVVEGLPLRYLVIPKCGCTYVKNILWQLRTGGAHPNPLRVHNDDGLFRRASDLGLTVEQIAAEQFAFTVIRHPIDRFLSLYFDKIVGSGRTMFVPLAQVLERGHGLNPAPTSLDDHQANLLITINWLRDNLARGIDLEPDAHWTPQVWRKNIMKSCNLKLLQVDQLTSQLRYLLVPQIPQLEGLLQGSEQNRSSRTVQKSSVLTRDIRAAVNEVYAADKTLYQRVSRHWSALDGTPAQPERVPRYRDLFPGKNP